MNEPTTLRHKTLGRLPVVQCICSRCGCYEYAYALFLAPEGEWACGECLPVPFRKTGGLSLLRALAEAMEEE